MSGIRRGLMLLAALVAMIAGCVNMASAQVATTTVADTVYSANGTPAVGTILVSWNSFTTTGGQTVPAGNTSVTLGAGGQFTIALAPNAGATPMGSYYTAVFHLSDGTTSREYWVVPVTVPGAGPATLAEIKNQVLPVSVAMQTVSKQYVDNAIAAAATGFPLDSSPYVQKAGDTMAGPLLLPADPVSANQAADKNYVDENVAATAGGLGQKVSLLPSGNQTVTQPSGTSFGINGVSANTTFAGSGTTAQSTITSGNTAANPNTGAYTLLTNQSNCFESGYDLGNNGTAAQGWSDCHLETDTMESATRGISQMHSGDFSHFAQGDTAAFYTYLTSFGGNVATSDEAVTHTVEHTNQIGYYSGTVATGGTTGSNLLTTTSFTCHGFCGTLDNNQFADGGILLDTSKGGSTATLATQGGVMNGLYYTLATGAVPVSTAWGNIIPSSCTNNGNGQWQNYTTTTCNVTLGTSPASPSNFVAGTDACFAGPFQEEAAVTAVGSPSAGVQSITFNTRYAWNSGDAALVMQGGSCGESLVATNSVSSWPVAYAVVGATSPSQVFFSNCVIGSCNAGGNVLGAAVPTSQPVLTRAGNVVTAAPNPYNIPNLTSFPAGSTVIVSGYTPSDLNGTFTVVSNSLDNENPSITWAQTGVNEASSAEGTIALPAVSVTFFPSAFITGTNNGVSGNVQLATNQVPFATGDTVVGAPTSQFQNSGLNIYMGQTTPVSGGWASQGVMVNDEGPSQLTNAFSAFNKVTNGAAPEMFNISGSYNNVFRIGYRPANNGTLLYVQGGEPVSANAKPYFIFQDNQTVAGKLGFDPISGTFSFNGPITTPSMKATVSASAFALGTTIGGSLPCLQNGTDCPAGTGSGSGTGSVTSVATGAWPSWLTPAVANATTTPSLAVVASPIPNGALANSATTVNGQSCALGSACMIAITSTQLTGTLNATQLPIATTTTQGGVQLPNGAASNVLGAAAMLPASTTVNGQSCVLGSACTVAVASTQVTGTLSAAQLPGATATMQGVVQLPSGATSNVLGAAAMLSAATTVNGTTCALGGSCTIATGSSTPPLTYAYFPAAVSDGGAAYAGAFARYGSNEPQAGSVASASSALGYLLFQATPAQPQYAELTTLAPPFWTGSGLYLNFYSTATSGNAVLDIQTACVVPGGVVGSPTFSTPVVTTTAVSSTANGLVRTALISGVATPGVNGCPAIGTTTPTMLTIRVYGDATSSVPVYFTGATLVTGRSQ